MIADRLTMRAQVERNQATGTDGWNNPVEPDFQPVGAPLRCFVWSKSGREAVGDERTALIEDVRGMFALDADLQPDDELVSVTDRSGETIHFGRLKVEGPLQPKHTHREANLQRIG